MKWWLHKHFPNWACPWRWEQGRPAPDDDIGPGYLHRWLILPRNRIFNIYLHHIMQSDDERALHDHPWPNISIVLKGAYMEESLSPSGLDVLGGRRLWARYYSAFWNEEYENPSAASTYRPCQKAYRWLEAWSLTMFKFRRSWEPHRLIVPVEHKRAGVWSLFITGPRVRMWGFHCPRGWLDYKRFTDPHNPNHRGPGCGG